MKPSKHDRIEALAGAIALGEATDAERLEYREHISACASCLKELGGEHEIERVSAAVADARESETWAPEVGNVVLRRTRNNVRKFQYGFGIAGLCIAVSLGVHAIAASSFSPLSFGEQRPVAIELGTTRIVLEDRSRPASAPISKPVPAPQPQRQLAVMHNVVSMQRQPVSTQQRSAAPAAAGTEVSGTNVVVHPREPRHAKRESVRPIWEDPQSQSWRTVATTTTVSQLETAPQTLAHHAESIQFAIPAHRERDREASVIGGETAINPQPPMIAYDEGAQGTSAFEVVVDEKGAPVKCVITKSSGYVVLDNAVCKAAMAAKYQPKIQDGRAVEGVYRDAFTFRMQENPAIEGLPVHPQIKFP